MFPVFFSVQWLSSYDVQHLCVQFIGYLFSFSFLSFCSFVQWQPRQGVKNFPPFCAFSLYFTFLLLSDHYYSVFNCFYCSVTTNHRLINSLHTQNFIICMQTFSTEQLTSHAVTHFLSVVDAELFHVHRPYYHNGAWTASCLATVIAMSSTFSCSVTIITQSTQHTEGTHATWQSQDMQLIPSVRL